MSASSISAFTRRRLGQLSVGLFSALACAIAAPALAQSYPSKPVKIIVPYGPGTAPDSFARITADALQKRLGQTFLVENRPGAGGKIGTEVAAGAPPDGYSLFLGTKDTQSIMRHLYPDWTIQPEKSLIPIAGLTRIENVIVTRTASTLNTIQDVLATGKTKELTYGTPGVGTNLHLMGALVQSRQNLKLVHVPYSRSFAEALPATVRGEIDMLIAGLPPMLPFIKDGRIKALAITGSTRSKLVPDVPTFAEAGIRDLETGGWFALFAPAGTPSSIVSKLGTEVAEILKQPEVLTRLQTMSAEAWAATPTELSNLIEAESLRWGNLIRDNQIVVK